MFLRVFLAALTLALLIPSAAPAAPVSALQEDQTVKLPCGRTIKVLSVSKVEYSKGVMALMVRYQTSLSIEAHKAISEEVNDVWKLTQRQVERLGYGEAILSSNEVPRGVFLTSSRVENFIFEKESDGKWTRLTRSDFMAAQ